MKIATRIYIAFGFLCAILTGIGTFSYFQIKIANDLTEETSLRLLPNVRLALQIQSLSNRLRLLDYARAVSPDQAWLERMEELLTGLRVQIRSMLQQYAEIADTAEEQALIKTIQEEFERYAKESEKSAVVARTFDIMGARNILESDIAVKQIADIRAALDRLVEINDARGQANNVEADAAFDKAVLILLLIIAISIGATTGVCIYLVKAIRNPIAVAVQSAQKVAAGDLTHDIDTHSTDELGLLLQALNNMQLSLRSTLQQVASGADQLAAAAEELNVVTNQSSSNLGLQDSEINQAATATTEMSAAVEEVAGNASATSESSQQAYKESLSGCQVAKDAEAAMDKMVSVVSSSAQNIEELAAQVTEISKLLEVIGSIAEQTNLLALNAAIEAARAGEHGRGFAVVADEVRALAARTQASTEQIEQIIGRIGGLSSRAVSGVNECRTFADDTKVATKTAGDALLAISQRISDIRDRNVLIATAAEEQAQVSREIDQNLTKVKDLSTQSSEGAKQVDAASHQLSELAIRFNKTVAQFKL